jgi:hypothetical protein
MTLEQIQKALQHRNLKVVSETVGIPYYTIWRIASGKSQRPAFQDVEAIKAYLEQN